jgi:glutamine cyclotransferase
MTKIIPIKMKPAFAQLALMPLFAALAPLLAGQAGTATRTATAPEYTYKVIHVFPHDPAAYTQGLFYHQGLLYEGTGLHGRSSLRKVRLETGEVLQRVNLAPEFFGEGVALLNNQVVQLTWQSHVGFIYELSDFRLVQQFSCEGEGWGLTSNGRDLFMSDGTAEIRVLDGRTFAEKRRLKVHDGNMAITELNELEWVEGEIFANVWHTDRIARISPQSGKVVGWINLKDLLSPMYRRQPEAVLNGIAYDPQGKRLFVTGKLWPSIFEIQLVAKERK